MGNITTSNLQAIGTKKQSNLNMSPMSKAAMWRNNYGISEESKLKRMRKGSTDTQSDESTSNGNIFGNNPNTPIKLRKKESSLDRAALWRMSYGNQFKEKS